MDVVVGEKKMEREPGFYWVWRELPECEPEVLVALWDGDSWQAPNYIPDQASSAFSEIGPRIEPPKE